MLVWFLPLFLVFLLIGLPVFFSLLAAPGILLWLNGQASDAAMLYRNIYYGIDSFPLMAIPFFMLAGELMNRSGITLRLVEFSQAMMGHLRGGLAQVNILSSILFAGLSGSAVADTSAIGSMLIPAMEKQGYSRKFAAAITAATSGRRRTHTLFVSITTAVLTVTVFAITILVIARHNINIIVLNIYYNNNFIIYLSVLM